MDSVVCRVDGGFVPSPHEWAAMVYPSLLETLMSGLSEISVGALIPFQFAGDRHTVFADYVRNLSGTLPGFVQGRYIVSLGEGQLSIFLHKLLFVRRVK